MDPRSPSNPTIKFPPDEYPPRRTSQGEAITSGASSDGDEQASAWSRGSRGSFGIFDAPRRFSTVLARRLSMAPAPDSFEYENLGRKDIVRLIELNPKNRKSPEGYNIRTYYLDGAPAFYALSHSFDPQERSASITCNNQSLSITPRLKTGLKELMKVPELCTWFWIDEICVNDNDVDERAHVTAQLRKRIYGQAKQTVVWLTKGGVAEEGKRDLEHSLNVAEVIYRVGVGSNELSLIDQDPAGRIVRVPKTRGLKDASQLPRMGLPHVMNPRWQGLVRLFEHPWFSSIWTVCEVALSREHPMVAVRGELLPMYNILWAGAFIYQNAHILRVAYNSDEELRPALSHANNLLLRRATKPLYHLQNLLWRTDDYFADDPRDRFFALVSMAVDFQNVKAMPRLIEPNYTLTLGEVARNFTRYNINETKRLLLLALHDHEPKALEDNHFVASWAYMPTKCRGRFGLRYEELGSENDPRMITRSEHHASRLLEADVLESEDANVLILGGVRVDSVRTVAPVQGNSTKNGIFQWMEAAHRELSDRTGKLDFADFLSHFVYTIDQPWNPYAAIEPWIEDLGRWLKTQIRAGNKAVPGYFSQVLDDLDSAYPADRLIRHDIQFWMETWDKNIQRQVAQLVVTEQDDLALAPFTVKAGDVVAVLFGGEFPFLLREVGDRFRFVGECFLTELNDGQALDRMEKGELSKDYFKLI